ncbi:unnamed protein product [marine sediment metagenome]|uniref:Transposase zinc-binding domain-containing protein n=1 Tax=marine sediment metagenome TaxID=412755 RepID=X1RX96_9ZZZZ
MKSLRDLRDTLIEHNVRDAKLMDFTFTLPGEITDWLMQQNHGLTHESEVKAWAMWRKFFHGSFEPLLLNGEPGELGSRVNLHPWSSREPNLPHWHFHGLALNQSYNGERFTRIEHFLMGDNLEKLKGLWKSALLDFASQYGIEVPSLDGDALPVVFYQYIDWNDMARLMHKWKYVSRSPIEDFAVYSNANPGCDNPPDWLEEYTNRARAFGWFRKIKAIVGKERFEAMRQDKKRQTEKTCPLCGERMESIGVLTNTEMLVKAQSGLLTSLEWVDGKLSEKLLSPGDVSFLT